MMQTTKAITYMMRTIENENVYDANNPRRRHTDEDVQQAGDEARGQRIKCGVGVDPHFVVQVVKHKHGCPEQPQVRRLHRPGQHLKPTTNELPLSGSVGGGVMQATQDRGPRAFAVYGEK
jgi:hypothetical protein